MSDIIAQWSIDLYTDCPKCKNWFDMLDQLSGQGIDLCEHDTLMTKDYETVCPECGHEFYVDFQY